MEKEELTFQEKIVKIQTSLKAPKNQRNTFGNYNYRSCEDILEAVKPLLKETNLHLTLNDEVELVGDRYYIRATATISSGAKTEDGRFETLQVCGFARETVARRGMDESQITGAASSYSRKYALNGLFCIDDTKDSDVVQNSKPSIKAPEEKPQPKPLPAAVKPDKGKPSPVKPQVDKPGKELKNDSDAKKPLSTTQRFINARKSLGDEDYYHILNKFHVKSATEFKMKHEAQEALDALEKNVELKDFADNGAV